MKNKFSEIALSIVVSAFAGASIAYLGLKSLVIIPLVLLGLIYIAFLKNKFSLFHFVIILIPMIIFSPNISLPVGPAFRLDDMWLVVGASLLILRGVFGKVKIQVPQRKIFWVFIGFSIWIFITIYASIIKEPYFYSNRDWLEILKNLKLVLVMLIAANLSVDKKRLNKIINTIIWSLVAASLFGIAQYFNFAGVNSWLTPYYLADSQVLGFERNSRVVGTFANPNVFAGFLVIGISISFSRLLNDSKIFQVVPLIIFLSSLILTASRTGVVCAIIVVVLTFFMSLAKGKKKLRIMSFSALFALVPFMALKMAPDRFFTRMDGLQDISADNSFSVRVERWRMIYQSRVDGNELIGTGPVSNLHFYYDNEWLQILTNYGVIGVLILLVAFALVYRTAKKATKQNIDLLNLSIAGRCLIVSFAFYMSTLAVFQQLQLMPLIMVIFGVLLSPFKETDMNRKSNAYAGS